MDRNRFSITLRVGGTLGTISGPVGTKFPPSTPVAIILFVCRPHMGTIEPLDGDLIRTPESRTMASKRASSVVLEC